MSKRRTAKGREQPVEPLPAEKRVARRTDNSSVAFRTSRLEPRLVWAIALFTIWSCLVLSPGASVVWLLALYASSIGAWSRLRPAGHQAIMLARAALLLVGAFVLQVSADTGGADGPYFIWPVMVVAVYSLLVSGRWRYALWSLAALEFVVSRAFSGTAPSWQLALAQAGVLAAICFIAHELRQSMDDMENVVEQASTDPTSRLYNDAGFFANGSLIFDDCRRRNRPFTMVLLYSANLRDVADVAGKKAANQLFGQLVRSIDAATPGGSLAARTDAVEFGLALAGMTAVQAGALLEDKFGQPPKVEVTLSDVKLTVMLDSVVAQATADVATLEDMYDRLRAKLLRRSGVDHTKPAEMHSTLQGMLQSDPAIPFHARPTVPMPLGKTPSSKPRRIRPGRA
ncbi:diguanylate cyclase [Caenimonas koreensis DSM 17982]|uniref:Diguanylate cyclase n=1 Tax=Caenimonas koreensis DSM 17982 TaxID=1121255 RepID=A0A844ATW2_9BURK|nr:GGDEF domain-containing protein [Caenimonas koreensis]MRD47785.1 diguanylate cyclase [Caenimonas koreensis DSM 17982]